MKKSAQELYSSLWLPIGHGNFRMSRILFLVMISGKHFCSSLFKFYLVYLGDLGQPLNPLHLPLQVLSCLSRWSWTTSQPSAPPSSSSILFISVILDNLSTLCRASETWEKKEYFALVSWLSLAYKKSRTKSSFSAKKLTNFSKFCGVLKKVFKNHNIGKY